MTTKIITSRDNAEFRRLKSLLEGKGIAEHARAIMSGDKFVSECIARHSDRIAHVVYASGMRRDLPTALRAIELGPDLFRELDVFGTNAPLLEMQVTLPTPADASAVTRKGVSVVLPFQHPDNIGAALRTCAAFGVDQVLLTREAANPYLPKALRAAGPNVFALRLHRIGALADLTLGAEQRAFVFDSGGKPLPDVMLGEPCVLVFGLEGQGVGNVLPQATRVAIPMQPGVESLNAGHALAVVLYQSFVLRR